MLEAATYKISLGGGGQNEVKTLNYSLDFRF